MKRCLICCLSLFFVVNLYSQDFYDVKKMVEIKIYFKQPRWEKTLDSMKDSRLDTRILADVVVNGTRFAGAGIRYKGNSSYNSVRKKGLPKLPFNIKLNYSNKTLKLPGGHTTLKLSNGFRDPSCVREVLAYEIARNYAPVSKANFAKVFINDKYLGLYTNVESVDAVMLDRNFGDHKGPFIKGDPDWRAVKKAGCPDGEKSSLIYQGSDTTCYKGYYEADRPVDWIGLVNFTRTLNKQPADLEKKLDIDQALWMLAFDNVLVNLDSYIGAFSHNYYLYSDSTGVFHPIIWDLNLAFGGFRLLNDERQLNDEELKQMSLFIHYKEQNTKRPLIIQLLSNDLYRKMYIAHCKTLYEDYLLNGLYLQRAKELQTFIAKDVKADKNKLYSDDAFEKNLSETTKIDEVSVIGIAELMEARKEVIGKHPLIAQTAPSISEVKSTLITGEVHISAKFSDATKAWVFYREKGVGAFQKMAITLSADANTASQLTLPGNKGLQFYIVAENERTASLSPKKAGMELHKVL
jgi:hypothetical protein